MKRWEVEGWQQDDIDKLQLSFLERIFLCKDSEGVDGTVTFARYLNKIGVNPDNYPMYLKIIGMHNHWVVDALIGNNDPTSFFKKVQPNYFIIQACFKSMTNSKRNGIYSKSLLVYLGLLKQNYANPLEGYRVYPVDTTDVNNLGKHLDESKDQRDDINKEILAILDKIASLLDPGRPEDDQKITAVATQANNIRGKFLDMTKSLREAIPDLLLEPDDLKLKEVKPSIT